MEGCADLPLLKVLAGLHLLEGFPISDVILSHLFSTFFLLFHFYCLSFAYRGTVTPSLAHSKIITFPFPGLG